MRQPLPSGYLHTEGARILDENNQPVRLAGVNWYGFDCSSLVAGGLDHASLADICGLIAQLGFNLIRLPFAVQAVAENPVITRYLDAEPQLQGKPALEIMDALIAAAGGAGLKVVLDSHRAAGGWSTQENGLWYTRQYPEETWLDSWEQLVWRYAGNATVIGCDLHNEPGSPAPDASAWPANGGALWGYGNPVLGGSPRDWAVAATRAANRILRVNPQLLILIEGVRYDPAGPAENNDLYWFGGNLTGVRSAAFPHRLSPVRIELEVPNQLVYSVHDYGPDMYAQLPWCQLGSTASTPEACNRVWDETWGFVAEQDMAPIVVGEFGTPNGHHPGDRFPPESYTEVNDRNPQGNWFTYLIDYIGAHDLSWTYWCLNGTQCAAPGRNPARPDWYGILNPGWQQAASESLLRKLQSVQ